MKEVFLSYSHENKEEARRLSELLNSNHISSWFDENQRPGDNIPIKISENIDASNFFICLISEKYLNSSFCLMELSMAIMKKHQNGLNYIIPIKIDECQLPPILSPLSYLMFSDIFNSQNALDKLITTIKSPKYSEKPEQNLIEEKNFLSPIKFIFVVGNPGAGKSTFCRTLSNQLKEIQSNKTINFISDYPFLQLLFQNDKTFGISGRFRSDDLSEFEIIDPVVYDEALKLIYNKVIIPNIEKNDLTIIEFSRPQYDSVFLFYTVSALTNSCIVFLDVPIEKCIDRNENRRKLIEKRLKGNIGNDIEFQKNPDLHYVPPFVFDRFKKTQNQLIDQLMILSLLPCRRFFRIDNSNDGIQSYEDKVQSLISNEIKHLVSNGETISKLYQSKIQGLNQLITNIKNEYK